MFCKIQKKTLLQILTVLTENILFVLDRQSTTNQNHIYIYIYIYNDI